MKSPCKVSRECYPFMSACPAHARGEMSIPVLYSGGGILGDAWAFRLSHCMVIVVNYTGWICIVYKMSSLHNFIELMKVFPGTRCCAQNPIQEKRRWRELRTSSHSASHGEDTRGHRRWPRSEPVRGSVVPAEQPSVREWQGPWEERGSTCTYRVERTASATIIKTSVTSNTLMLSVLYFRNFISDYLFLKSPLYRLCLFQKLKKKKAVHNKDT